MLLRRKKHRTHGEDRLLTLTLATTAGVLNAMAFGAFGFFPSHMTGNISQLSAEAGRWDLQGLLFFGDADSGLRDGRHAGAPRRGLWAAA
ncbi:MULTISPECIES: DUF1275 family protein [Enterobacterales]|jgi:hypothetical protein|uniref:DUF1275 family protein n=1 Tax=Enterobacterales TaxID=91347 RepID=UPI0009078DA9